jgi:nicotinamide-nucleotide amidase
MKAEIITIGDEILIGQIVNTNAAWLAKALTEIGVECVSIRTVRDSHEDICCALDDALKKVDLIIFTGGFADLFKTSIARPFEIDKNITIKGIIEILKENRKYLN